MRVIIQTLKKFIYHTPQLPDVHFSRRLHEMNRVWNVLKLTFVVCVSMCNQGMVISQPLFLELQIGVASDFNTHVGSFFFLHE